VADSSATFSTSQKIAICGVFSAEVIRSSTPFNNTLKLALYELADKASVVVEEKRENLNTGNEWNCTSYIGTSICNEFGD
jgi:hypothetical protein